MKRKTPTMATMLARSHGDAPATPTGHFIRLR